MTGENRKFLANLEGNRLTEVFQRSQDVSEETESDGPMAVRALRAYLSEAYPGAIEFADFLLEEHLGNGSSEEFSIGVWSGAMLMLHGIRLIAEGEEFGDVTGIVPPQE